MFGRPETVSPPCSRMKHLSLATTYIFLHTFPCGPVALRLATNKFFFDLDVMFSAPQPHALYVSALVRGMLQEVESLLLYQLMVEDGPDLFSMHEFELNAPFRLRLKMIPYPTVPSIFPRYAVLASKRREEFYALPVLPSSARWD